MSMPLWTPEQGDAMNLQRDLASVIVSPLAQRVAIDKDPDAMQKLGHGFVTYRAGDSMVSFSAFTEDEKPAETVLYIDSAELALKGTIIWRGEAAIKSARGNLGYFTFGEPGTILTDCSNPWAMLTKGPSNLRVEALDAANRPPLTPEWLERTQGYLATLTEYVSEQ